MISRILGVALLLPLVAAQSLPLQLNPGGAHVCPKDRTFHRTETFHFHQTRIIAEHVKCHIKNNWLWKEPDSLCLQYRLAHMPIRRTEYKRFHNVTYTCCEGWTRDAENDTECTIPVCSPACQNFAACIAPGVCQCSSGFTGSRCETSNVQTGPGGKRTALPVCKPTCQHSAVCVAPGVCKCPEGPKKAVCEILNLDIRSAGKPSDKPRKPTEWLSKNLKGYCPADENCAHYNVKKEGECCATCRKNISICSHVNCPAVTGCVKYAEQPTKSGDCCLPCLELSGETLNRSPCHNVICPDGMECVRKRETGRAVCRCQNCCSKTLRKDRVNGTNGRTYKSLCHLEQAACRQCEEIKVAPKKTSRRSPFFILSRRRGRPTFRFSRLVTINERLAKIHSG